MVLQLIAVELGSLCVAVTKEDVCHTCLLFGRDGIAAFAVAVVVTLLAEYRLHQLTQAPDFIGMHLQRGFSCRMPA